MSVARRLVSLWIMDWLHVRAAAVCCEGISPAVMMVGSTVHYAVLLTFLFILFFFAKYFIYPDLIAI